MAFKKNNQDIFPHAARQNDDTKGVEDISPGLPESARATPGFGSIESITFARSAASGASISGRCAESGAVRPKLIIWLSIPVVLVALVFGWFFLTRHKLERERTDWKTATLVKLASLSLTNKDTDIVEQLEPSGLKNWGEHPWIGEQVLLMSNHEYLVFAFRHGFNNGGPPVSRARLRRTLVLQHVSFLQRNGHDRSDDQPGSIAEFASRYAVHEFDGKSDVCLQHTWPLK